MAQKKGEEDSWGVDDSKVPPPPKDVRAGDGSGQMAASPKNRRSPTSTMEFGKDMTDQLKKLTSRPPSAPESAQFYTGPAEAPPPSQLVAPPSSEDKLRLQIIPTPSASVPPPAPTSERPMRTSRVVMSTTPEAPIPRIMRLWRVFVSFLRQLFSRRRPS